MKWNISVIEGKEIDQDSVSTGEGMRIDMNGSIYYVIDKYVY